jgi:hypothetical protein
MARILAGPCSLVKKLSCQSYIYIYDVVFILPTCRTTHTTRLTKPARPLTQLVYTVPCLLLAFLCHHRESNIKSCNRLSLGQQLLPDPVSAPSVDVQQDSLSAHRQGSSSSPTVSSLHLLVRNKIPRPLVFGAAAAPWPYLRSIRLHAGRLLIMVLRLGGTLCADQALAMGGDNLLCGWKGGACPLAFLSPHRCDQDEASGVVSAILSNFWLFSTGMKASACALSYQKNEKYPPSLVKKQTCILMWRDQPLCLIILFLMNTWLEVNEDKND